MDCDKLIAVVEQHAALWDQKNKSYHNRDIIKRLWKKVSLEMNEKEETVRQKWRGLRDTFRKEMYKANSDRSGDGVVAPHSKWQYFTNMSFLRDQFQPRAVTGNICNAMSLQTEEPETNEVQSEFEADVGCPNKENRSHVHELPKTSNPTKKSRNVRQDAINKLLLLENQKLEYFKNKSDTKVPDDDYYFAMSIVPYMREVPSNRKLHLRTKIQQLILEEQREVPSQQYNTLQYHFTAAPPSPSPVYSCSSTETSNQTCSLPVTCTVAQRYGEDDVEVSAANITTSSFLANFQP